MHTAAPSVSIVVPVYNEVPSTHSDTLTPRIQKLIELLRPCDEIVLVDGGSTDVSWQILQALAAHPQITAIQSEKGRARQMNRGAAVAKGDLLLFLHADTELNASAWTDYLYALSATGSKPVWGRFNVRIAGQSKWLPVVAWFMNQRSRFSKIATGDQGLFASRQLFDRVGGFPDQPLMEDIEWSKRLKQLAEECFLPIQAPLITSGRRWDTQGAWKTILLMWRFRFQYWRGVSAAELARQYADAREKTPLTVAVFAKYPLAGRVKTRLEPLLGPEQCAAFARYLLLSTLDKLHGVNVVLWTDGGSEEQWNTLLAGRRLSRCIQPEGHLGVRMQTAVQTHLKRSDVVVLLGPDAVQFTVEHLKALQEAAKKHELAFVPALDGGYVAMGCATCIPSVFSETIHWGTGSVADQTRVALQGQGLEAKWFDAQLDIDEPEDLQMAVSQGCVPEDWSERYPYNGV